MRDCEETGDLLAALNSQCRMGLAQGLSRDPLNQHALGGDPDAVGEMNDFHRKLAEIASEYMARTWAAFDRRQMLAPGTSQPSRDEWLRVIRMFYLHEICQREMIIARRGREAPRQERGFVSAKAKDTLDAPWRKWLQKLAFWEAEQLFCIVTYLRSVFDGLQARLDSNHLHRLEDGKILLPPNNMNFHGVALLYEAHRVEDASERADLLTADDRAYVWTITSMGLRNHLSTLGGLKGGMMFTQDSFPDPSSGAKCAWKWSLGPSESIIQVGRERTADARDWGYMFMDRERLEQHQVLNQPFLVRGSLPRDRPR
ncbi:uncharacterized protein BO97DRAFT_29309 [Aspergillus homomorphus CBS 101889]|uniref:Uncharacterized protein n=1 Tax=Aspergillus homomorphus (strain CBS 101889) TaxID=1450537 RepID=A0A395I2M0_ASPHC|nr:hypothetical protein BO97DRAFT_29309 [Aspergillus homomorphus CBS 101889]RAL13913.1 hypothetical protein BO97DRAFT_29309 [Aspergillus homomorphus CBS 101889]